MPRSGEVTVSSGGGGISPTQATRVARIRTAADREREEVMGFLSETDGIDMTFNDDESVTLRWEPQAEEDRAVEVDDVFATEEPAPF
jgi:hypothetical protein